MIPKKETPKRVERKLPKSKESTTKVKESKLKKKVVIETRLPKSEYAEDGTPLLNILGIDDIDLKGTINDFLY